MSVHDSKSGHRKNVAVDTAFAVLLLGALMVVYGMDQPAVTITKRHVDPGTQARKEFNAAMALHAQGKTSMAIVRLEAVAKKFPGTEAAGEVEQQEEELRFAHQKKEAEEEEKRLVQREKEMLLARQKKEAEEEEKHLVQREKEMLLAQEKREAEKETRRRKPGPPLPSKPAVDLEMQARREFNAAMELHARGKTTMAIVRLGTVAKKFPGTEAAGKVEQQKEELRAADRKKKDEDRKVSIAQLRNKLDRDHQKKDDEEKEMRFVQQAKEKRRALEIQEAADREKLRLKREKEKLFARHKKEAEERLEMQRRKPTPRTSTTRRRSTPRPGGSLPGGRKKPVRPLQHKPPVDPERQAEKELNKAVVDLTQGRTGSAIVRLEALYKRFPGTKAAGEARERAQKLRLAQKKEDAERGEMRLAQQEKAAEEKLKPITQLTAQGKVEDARKRLTKLLGSNRRIGGTKAAQKLESELAAAEEKEAAEQFRSARALHTKGKTKEALEKLQAVCRTFPNTRSADEARRSEKEILLAQREKEAKETLEPVGRLINSGQMDEARQKLQALAKERPQIKSSKAMRDLSNQLAVAEKKKQNENLAQKKLTEAKKTYKSRQLDKARKLFEAIISEFPKTDAAVESRRCLTRFFGQSEQKEEGSSRSSVRGVTQERTC